MRTEETMMKINFGIITILAVLVSGCMGSTLVEIQQSKPVSLNQSMRTQVERTVTNRFFDPESARFRDIRAAKVSLADGTSATRVCGQVNAKNRMGGYVGYKYFGGELIDGKFVQQDFFGPCEPW
jgi:hypothetical protein